MRENRLIKWHKISLMTLSIPTDRNALITDGVVLEFTNHHAGKQTNQMTQNLVYNSRALILKVAEVKWEDRLKTEDGATRKQNFGGQYDNVKTRLARQASSIFNTLQMFYFFRTLPPISVLSARTTCLTMKEFLERKPNEKFTGLEFFSSS